MGGHWKRGTRERRQELRPGAVVYLTPEERAIVCRPVNGTGGHQGLLLRIVPKVTPADRGRLELTPDELEQVRRYAVGYGPGGYQDRFKVILAALERADETRGNR